MISRDPLKKLYDTLHQDIMQLESSCIGLGMQQVIDQFIVESADGNAAALTACIDGLRKEQLKDGVLLHDLSGIGLYLLAYILAKEWADGKILQQYDAVIVMPIEWMNLLKKSNPATLEDILSIWQEMGVAPAAVAADKVLVIVSGCTAPKLRTNEKANTERHHLQWLEQLHKLGIDSIFVSNAGHLDYLKNHPATALKISLQPLNMELTYACNKRVTQFSITGKSILKCGTEAVENIFYHANDKTAHIEHTSDWHEQLPKLLTGDIESLQHDEIKPEHIYPPLKAQRVVDLVLSHVTKQAGAAQQADDALYSFTTPAEWYSAAVTVAVEVEKKNATCYRIGNYLIVRRLSDQYVASIDLATDVRIDIPKGLKEHYEENELSDLIQSLQALKAEADFENLPTDALLSRLDRITAGKRKESKRKLKESSEQALKFVKDHIRKEDPAQTRYNNEFARGQNELRYHEMQPHVNEELSGIKHKTQFVRDIMSGKQNHARQFVVLAMAATLLSETARYRTNFLTTLCLLDLIEDSPDEAAHWEMFFAHRRYTHNEKITTFRQGLKKDIVNMLGGLQAMSHGNSFHQTKPTAEKPAVGMHWVDFKSHLILGYWLCHMIRKERDLNPNIFSRLVRESNHPSITPRKLDLGKFGHMNPHLYDKFSRRLCKFTFMLVERRPLRELLSSTHAETVKFVTEQAFPKIYRLMFPRFIEPNQRDNKICYTLPYKFCQAIQLPLEAGQQRPYFYKTFINNQMTDISITEAQQFNIWLLEILEVDPSFYVIHYYIARISLYSFKDAETGLIQLENYFQKAKPADGDIYYCAQYIRLRCLFATRQWRTLIKEIKEYLKNYTDQEDYDYWRAHFLRAYVNDSTGAATAETILKDLHAFLSNVPYEQSADYEVAIDLINKYYPSLKDHPIQPGLSLHESIQVIGNTLNKNGTNLYLHRNGFLSTSRFATQDQPYGPYRDRFCQPNTPTDQFTEWANAKLQNM